MSLLEGISAVLSNKRSEVESSAHSAVAETGPAGIG